MGSHDHVLYAIWRDPVSGTIPWRDIESLLRSLGAEITERKGSRIAVALNGQRAIFHRPHPRKEADKGAVKSVRRFLALAGVSLP